MTLEGIKKIIAEKPGKVFRGVVDTKRGDRITMYLKDLPDELPPVEGWQNQLRSESDREREEEWFYLRKGNPLQISLKLDTQGEIQVLEFDILIEEPEITSSLFNIPKYNKNGYFSKLAHHKAMSKNVDHVESKILERRAKEGKEPMVGDFIDFGDGEYLRIAGIYNNGTYQPTTRGSFHLLKGGRMDFSGGLDMPRPIDELELSDVKISGSCWVWDADRVGAHRGVSISTELQVWEIKGNKRRKRI